MKNHSNLHLMQEAEQRRSMINTYYKEGMKRGLWFGFFVGITVGMAIGAMIK
jgi:hypothetical protein